MSPRLALVGALPFPLPQGSQVYLAEQACALSRAGASVTIVCYGGGTEDTGVLARLADAGVEIVRAPRLLSRAPLRAGPAAGKPLADLALLGALRREHARRPFDALLAHNAEAAFIGLALRARAARAAPVVYVAHTLLAHELSAYAPRALARACDALGARLDRALARRADAVIALSSDAARALARDARGRVALLPPGLDPAPAPGDDEIDRACARAGVARAGFALYSGNLDRYQDLDELAAAARFASELPVVVATHDPARSAPSPLRVARLASAAEGRALLHGAACAVLARRRPGGFPVKLLNYMEAARAIVAREGVADGLVHGESAWLLAPGDGPDALAIALRELARDRAHAARLGAGARRVLETRHAWPALARETLALVEVACGA